MNEKQYLDALEKQLYKLNSKERADIIRDFEEYFDNGRNEGKMSEEIIEGLGSVEQLAEELYKAYSEEDFVEQHLVDFNELSKVKNIEAKVDGVNFIITPTDRAEPYIDIKDKDDRTEVDMKIVGDTLYLHAKRKDIVKRFLFITFVGNFGESELILYLPKQQYNMLDVYNDDGAIRVEHIHASTFDIESDNGRIVVDQLVGDKLNCETDNGRIQLHNLSFNEIKAYSDNGRIIAEHVKAKINNLETDNGRIELKQIEGTITAVTDNGRIEAFLSSIVGDNVFKTDNGSIKIVSPGEFENVSIDAKTSWGAVSIYGENTNLYLNGSASSTLKLRSDNGKINVTTEEAENK